MAEIRLNKDARKNPYWFQVMVRGKRVTRRGFRTKAEARAAMAEIVNDLNNGDYIKASKVTFGDYFYSWLMNRTTISETTRKMYQSYFKNHIQPALGEKSLSSLSPMDILTFVKSLADKGLSQETVKRIYSTLNASLSAAERMELIRTNAAAKIEKPKVRRVERKVWSEESIKMFLEAAKDKSRYWIAFYIAVMTGMRQGEILAVQWSDVDLQKQVITVNKSLRKDTAVFDLVKTEKSRRNIAISQSVVEQLLLHKEKIDWEKLRLGSRYRDHNLVVPSSLGTPARATKVTKIWHSLQEQYKPAKEPFMTFHDLRHLHATLLLRSNIHIKVVSERLGHSNVNITLNTYSHVLPNLQEEAARKIEELML